MRGRRGTGLRAARAEHPIRLPAWPACSPGEHMSRLVGGAPPSGASQHGPAPWDSSPCHAVQHVNSCRSWGRRVPALARRGLVAEVSAAHAQVISPGVARAACAQAGGALARSGAGSPLTTQHWAGLREPRGGTRGLWPGGPARPPWPADSATRPVSGPPGATCGFLSSNVQTSFIYSLNERLLTLWFILEKFHGIWTCGNF